MHINENTHATAVKRPKLHFASTSRFIFSESTSVDWLNATEELIRIDAAGGANEINACDSVEPTNDERETEKKRSNEVEVEEEESGKSTDWKWRKKNTSNRVRS